MIDFYDIQEIFVPKTWGEVFKAYHPTGSRFICDPHPMDTDEDYICLTYLMGLAADQLELLGFTTSGLYKAGFTQFMSFRKGDLNLIVTADKEFYMKYVEATLLAKKLNLRKKQDRIDLFTTMLEGIQKDGK